MYRLDMYSGACRERELQFDPTTYILKKYNVQCGKTKRVSSVTSKPSRMTLLTVVKLKG